MTCLVSRHTCRLSLSRLNNILHQLFAEYAKITRIATTKSQLYCYIDLNIYL